MQTNRTICLHRAQLHSVNHEYTDKWLYLYHASVIGNRRGLQNQSWQRETRLKWRREVKRIRHLTPKILICQPGTIILLL